MPGDEPPPTGQIMPMPRDSGYMMYGRLMGRHGRLGPGSGM